MAARRRIAKAQSDGDWLADVAADLDASWSKLSRVLVPLDSEALALSSPAPNAIEWVTGASWANVPSTYDYWGQYQTIRDFFALLCPVCCPGGVERGEPWCCWGKSRSALEDEVLLRWSQDHQEDVCPKCGSTRSELLEDGLIRSYDTLHCVVGQRSGKSVMAGLIGTYVEHRILTLGLQESQSGGTFGSSLGLDIQDFFEITFLASTDTQSADTIWAKMVAIRSESPWFQRFVPWIKSQEVSQVVPIGMKEWRYAESDKRIINQHPAFRLILNSLNSNAPGLRGRTRPAAFADEISHMEQTESRKSAGEIYRALERSLRTVRTRVKLHGGLPWLGCMVSVTSPVSRNDKGMELLRDADKVESMMTVHKPTWEFSGTETFEGMKDEFAKDFVGAWRDYGARPPGAEHPLIYDEARWRKLAVSDALKPTAKFETYAKVGPTGQHYLAAKAKSVEYYAGAAPRYVVFDAGIAWDAFAGACAHAELIEDIDAQGKPFTKTVTVFDWVLRILPQPGSEVLFDSVRDVMDVLHKNQPIVRCEFDRWQSLQLIQQVREFHIFAEQASLKDADWIQFRVDSYEGLVRMLPPDPDEYVAGLDTYSWRKDPPQLSAAGVAIYELLGAQCDPDTNKITFPEKGLRRGWGSNDVAQVIVHAHRCVQRYGLGFTDQHDDRSLRAARMRAEKGGRGWETRGAAHSAPAGAGGMRNWHSSKRGW